MMEYVDTDTLEKTMCDRCIVMVDNDDLLEVENGVFWCSDCRHDFKMEYNDLKTYCDQCGNMSYVSNIVEVENGVFWCGNCVYDFKMEMMIEE